MRTIPVEKIISAALLIAIAAPTLAAEGWQERVGALWQERLQKIVDDTDATSGNPVKEMEAWFSRQYNQKGGYCCSKADAYPFDGPYEITPEGGVKFELPDGAGTVVVPPENMLQNKTPPDPNLTGGAVIWYTGVLGPGVNANLYCFALGRLS